MIEEKTVFTVECDRCGDALSVNGDYDQTCFDNEQEARDFAAKEGWIIDETTKKVTCDICVNEHGKDAD
jgi:hypothetical protein